MESSSEKNQWSKLPKDLLITISKRLETSTDALRLRAVCSSWRSSLSPRPPKNNPPLFSVKFPFPIAPNPALNPKRRGHFALSERTIYYLEPCDSENPNPRSSTKGWMVSVEESSSKPGKMQMLDPLSKFKFERLPEISSKVIDLLNFKVSEVSKVCNLQFIGDRNDLDMEFNELKSINVKKVVMSSSIDESNVDCAVLTIHTGGKLGFFKLGDKKWSMIDDGHERSHYDDIVFRKGKFYAVDYKGRIIEIDLMFNVKGIKSPVHSYGMRCGGQYKYLVESLGDLYLVDKYSDDEGRGELYFGESDSDEGEDKEGDPDCFISFVVYKFKDEEQEWVQVTTLGDRVFFIGDDGGFSVSPTQFSGCKGDCIYFTDTDFINDDDFPGCGIGMFDMKNDSVGPLSSFKCYSQLFWPPPTWLKLKASSKSNPKTSSKPSPKSSSKPSSSRR